MKDFGKIISRLRKERDMSQGELATILNCSKQTVSNYERNARKPDYETLEAIADIFNVPMGFFLSEEEQKEKLKQIYKTYKNLENGIQYSGSTVGSEVHELTIDIDEKPRQSAKQKVEMKAAQEPRLSSEALSVARAYDHISDYGKAIIDTVIRQEQRNNVRLREVKVFSTAHDSDVYAQYHAKQELEELRKEEAIEKQKEQIND